MSTAIRPRSAHLAALAVLCLGAVGARAADVPLERDNFAGAPVSALGGGGYWAPLIPLRPAPTRFDIYGYPILGPGLVGRPAPHEFGIGCPAGTPAGLRSRRQPRRLRAGPVLPLSRHARAILCTSASPLAPKSAGRCSRTRAILLGRSAALRFSLTASRSFRPPDPIHVMLDPAT